MKPSRRAALARKVAAEKQQNALGVSSTEIEELAKRVTIAFTAHFMIEPQIEEADGEEEPEEVYAVYRISDLLSNTFTDGAGVDPIGPVHVFTNIQDALTAVAVLDKLVDKMEGEDAVSVTRDEAAPATAVQ